LGLDDPTLTWKPNVTMFMILKSICTHNLGPI
jgi:hypothetical protein